MKIVIICLLAAFSLAKSGSASKSRANSDSQSQLCDTQEIIPAHYTLGISVPWGGERIKQSEVNKAFRKAALKYHPDKQRDPRKEKLYSEIFVVHNTAKECLNGHKAMPDWSDAEIRGDRIKAWVQLQKTKMAFWWEEAKIDARDLAANFLVSAGSFVKNTVVPKALEFLGAVHEGLKYLSTLLPEVNMANH